MVRAPELDPDYTMSHVTRHSVGVHGQNHRGVAQLRRAQRLSRMAAPKACVGMLLTTDAACGSDRELEQTLAADEGSDHARRYLGRAYLRTTSWSAR